MSVKLLQQFPCFQDELKMTKYFPRGYHKNMSSCHEYVHDTPIIISVDTKRHQNYLYSN